MKFLQDDIANMLPELSWDSFNAEGDVYVTKYIPQIEDEDKRNRFYRLRDKYPSEYAAAVNSKLPEGATLVSYNHLTLELIVKRD